MRQAAIVDNKLLGRALQFAKEQQAQRDEKKLAAKSTTKRDKRLLRERQARAAALWTSTQRTFLLDATPGHFYLRMTCRSAGRPLRPPSRPPRRRLKRSRFPRQP